MDKEIKLGYVESILKNAKKKMKTTTKMKLNWDTPNLKNINKKQVIRDVDKRNEDKRNWIVVEEKNKRKK